MPLHYLFLWRRGLKMNSDKLYIVIPAYNEEETIESVVKEWHEVVKTISPESKLVIINDGSKDHTEEILNKLKDEYPQLIPVTKQNGGHGAAVLYGYHYALDNGADYVFQTDSDGQTLPSEFNQFWEQRDKYDVIIGSRGGRQDGISRVFVTKTLRFVIWLTFGEWVKDANTPFRLMKRDTLEKYIKLVPDNFFLSNVILSVLFTRYKVPMTFIPITFRPRQGGVNSINMKRIIKIGKQALKDFKEIKKNLDSLDGGH